MAGGLTGGINILIVFPTEYIKTQLQLDVGRTVLRAHHSRLVPGKMTPMATALSALNEKVYCGSLDVVKKTFKEQGMRGMYRGVQVLLAGTVPTYAVRFGVFDSLKAEIAGADGQLTPASRMMCGLSAGVAEAALVVTWIETLKVRLISDQRRKVPRYRGLVHAASTIARQEVGKHVKYFRKCLTVDHFPGSVGAVQGTETHSHQAGIQPGHQVLRDGVPLLLVHRGQGRPARPLLPPRLLWGHGGGGQCTWEHAGGRDQDEDAEWDIQEHNHILDDDDDNDDDDNHYNDIGTP